MRWLDSITDSVDMNLRKLWGILGASQVALVVKSPIANAGDTCSVPGPGGFHTLHGYWARAPQR